MARNDLKMIKEKYGEEMMHFCRISFPTILDYEGLLFKILSEHFDYYKYLLEDIKDWNLEPEFRNYIYSFFYQEEPSEKVVSKTLKELLDEAGYNLYECKTEDDIQSFRKYYAPGEELCTFHGGRLERCYVFFAVKKDVDSIKREDFDNPKREDKYGTSVISIQFTRDPGHVLSIKNRYNHTIVDENPDATFGNNLDNIIPGLTEAFETEYGLKSNLKGSGFDIPYYVLANDGKYYKYNFGIDNVYYCANNIIIDYFEVKRYDKAKYIIADCYVIDKVNKTIEAYDSELEDSFPGAIGEIDRIEELIDKKNKERTVVINGKTKIVLNKDNQIIGFYDEELKEIGDDFLSENRELKNISIPNVERIGDSFLSINDNLRNFSGPNLKSIGKMFLSLNSMLDNIDLPVVEKIDDDFMHRNHGLLSFTALNLREVGDNFFEWNNEIKRINLPNLEKVGEGFLRINQDIKNISLPKLKEAGEAFMIENGAVEEANFPELERVERNFLTNAPVKKFYAPKLNEAASDCLVLNMLEEANFPELEKVGDWFMSSSRSLKSISLPKLKEINGAGFLLNVTSLNYIYTPELEKINTMDFLKQYVEYPMRIEKPLILSVPNYKGDFEKLAEELSSEKLIVTQDGYINSEDHKKKGL